MPPNSAAKSAGLDHPLRFFTTTVLSCVLPMLSLTSKRAAIQALATAAATSVAADGRKVEVRVTSEVILQSAALRCVRERITCLRFNVFRMLRVVLACYDVYGGTGDSESIIDDDALFLDARKGCHDVQSCDLQQTIRCVLWDCGSNTGHRPTTFAEPNDDEGPHRQWQLMLASLVAKMFPQLLDGSKRPPPPVADCTDPSDVSVDDRIGTAFDVVMTWVDGSQDYEDDSVDIDARQQQFQTPRANFNLAVCQLCGRTPLISSTDFLHERHECFVCCPVRVALDHRQHPETKNSLDSGGGVNAEQQLQQLSCSVLPPIEVNSFETPNLTMCDNCAVAHPVSHVVATTRNPEAAIPHEAFIPRFLTTAVNFGGARGGKGSGVSREIAGGSPGKKETTSVAGRLVCKQCNTAVSVLVHAVWEDVDGQRILEGVSQKEPQGSMGAKEARAMLDESGNEVRRKPGDVVECLLPHSEQLERRYDGTMGDIVVCMECLNSTYSDMPFLLDGRSPCAGGVITVPPASGWSHLDTAVDVPEHHQAQESGSTQQSSGTFGSLHRVITSIFYVRNYVEKILSRQLVGQNHRNAVCDLAFPGVCDVECGLGQFRVHQFPDCDACRGCLDSLGGAWRPEDASLVAALRRCGFIRTSFGERDAEKRASSKDFEAKEQTTTGATTTVPTTTPASTQTTERRTLSDVPLTAFANLVASVAGQCFLGVVKLYATHFSHWVDRRRELCSKALTSTLNFKERRHSRHHEDDDEAGGHHVARSIFPFTVVVREVIEATPYSGLSVVALLPNTGEPAMLKVYPMYSNTAAVEGACHGDGGVLMAGRMPEETRGSPPLPVRGVGGPSYVSAVPNMNTLFLVYPWLSGGSLEALLAKLPRRPPPQDPNQPHATKLSSDVVRRFLRGVVDGLSGLQHQRRYVAGNVAPYNVFVDDLARTPHGVLLLDEGYHRARCSSHVATTVEPTKSANNECENTAARLSPELGVAEGTAWLYGCLVPGFVPDVAFSPPEITFLHNMVSTSGRALFDREASSASAVLSPKCDSWCAGMLAFYLLTDGATFIDIIDEMLAANNDKTLTCSADYRQTVGDWTAYVLAAKNAVTSSEASNEERQQQRQLQSSEIEQRLLNVIDGASRLYGWSDSALGFVKSCLVLDWAGRPALEQLASHDFLQQPPRKGMK